MVFCEKITGRQMLAADDREREIINKGSFVKLSFELCAVGVCTPFKVILCGSEYEYFAPVQKTRLIMPVSASEATSIAIETEGQIEIFSALVLECPDVDAAMTKSGMRMIDSYETIMLPETGMGVGGTTDVVLRNGLLYCIGGDLFTVVKNGQVIGRLTGIACRQLAVSESGGFAVVTGRDRGAFIIDVSDPTKPYIRSVYDSVEMATGLCISGNVAFICNRQYGVEAVDISDPDHPRHITNMRVGGEVQSCTVRNGVFYGGLWGEGLVKMYDVKDPVYPVFLGQAKLHGKGDGMSVCAHDGRTYLYAATGHHTKASLSPLTPFTDLRFGQGNGLDIFDVTDPSSPIWLSTSVAEGRYYFSGYDYWEAEVGEDAFGNRYAYLVSTFNGVYVYDVNDPRAPKRLMHIFAPISTDSVRYSQLKSKVRPTLLPYDQSVCGRAAFGAVALGDGVMYTACCQTDAFLIKNEKYFFSSPKEEDCVKIIPGNPYHALDTGRFESSILKLDGQVYGVREVNGQLAVSAGDVGIVFIDNNMDILSTFATKGTVLWCDTAGDMLYCAEKTAGLGIYKIDGAEQTTLSEQKRFLEGENVRHVTVSADGRYAVVQIAGSKVTVIDTESGEILISFRTHALAYHHNLSPLVGGRYVGVFDNAPCESWIDLGGERPSVIWSEAPSLTAMRTGFTAFGSGALEITQSGGIAVFDPAHNRVADAEVFGSGLYGKPSVSCDGKLLVACDRINGKVSVADISDITAPSIIDTFYVDGNPDIALIKDGSAYIPLGYQGLARIRIV